jgi:hypothetical protein
VAGAENKERVQPLDGPNTTSRFPELRKMNEKLQSDAKKYDTMPV